MSLTKKYLKSKPVCKVTFHLPKEAVNTAKEAIVVGEFNSWNTNNGGRMKRLKDGSFKKTIDLQTGKEYQFRYLIDGEVWENDWAADKYVPSGISAADNSVVVV